MRLFLSSIAALSMAVCVSPFLTAQTTQTQLSVQPQPEVFACPVEMAMLERPDGMLVPTKRMSPGVQQLRDFSVRNTQHQRIVGIELMVHGTSSKGRVIPTNAAAVLQSDHPENDAVSRLHLASSVAPGESRTNLLAVRDFTSIAYADVLEVRYADGSAWHAESGKSCRVMADPLMRIATNAH